MNRNSPQIETDRPRTQPALPAGIWMLGFVSLLMDVSSELIHSCCRSSS